MTTPRVFQISVSNGGVPKHAVHEAGISAAGVEGDRQNNTQNHGGPDRAVCLFSLERIMALQEEGHHIFPGSTGENVTVSGVAWDKVGPGTKLRLGDEVVIEIVSFAPPCDIIKESFENDEFARVSQDEHPGWARALARVLQPGRLKTGDAVSF